MISECTQAEPLAFLDWFWLLFCPVSVQVRPDLASLSLPLVAADVAATAAAAGELLALRAIHRCAAVAFAGAGWSDLPHLPASFRRAGNQFECLVAILRTPRPLQRTCLLVLYPPAWSICMVWNGEEQVKCFTGTKGGELSVLEHVHGTQWWDFLKGIRGVLMRVYGQPSKIRTAEVYPSHSQLQHHMYEVDPTGEANLYLYVLQGSI